MLVGVNRIHWVGTNSTLLSFDICWERLSNSSLLPNCFFFNNPSPRAAPIGPCQQMGKPLSTRISWQCKSNWNDPKSRAKLGQVASSSPYFGSLQINIRVFPNNIKKKRRKRTWCARAQISWTCRNADQVHV